jgi:arginine/lysine/ornithine decarboxylase
MVVALEIPSISAARILPFRSLAHRRAPLVDALRGYRDGGVRPFSTPGHKLGIGADPELVDLLGHEVFAADVWLNTSDYDARLREAEALAADAWGAESSFFLTNGSTAGNQALLLGALGPGDEVVVARGVHKSLMAGLILTGARPVWVTPRLHPELGLALGVDPGDVADALDTHPRARLVVLVSPTYWGVATDVAAVARVAHARCVPVYVDEAWGPHLSFHPALPRAAMASGADAAVTSAHKLLACLGQGAILNLQGDRIDAGRVATAVGMVRSTSPSLPILASLDSCRRQMALQGEALLDQTMELAKQARRRLRAISGLRVIGEDDLGGWDFDPTRLVVDVTGLGITGHDTERLLRRQFALAPEMSDLTGVVCLITVGDTAVGLDRLVAAFAAIAATAPGCPTRRPPGSLTASTAAIAPGEQAITPREAHFARSRVVPLDEAIGEIAAELVVPFPPGIPALVPGEVIPAEKVAYLQAGLADGMHVSGLADSERATVAVVVDQRAAGRTKR